MAVGYIDKFRFIKIFRNCYYEYKGRISRIDLWVNEAMMLTGIIIGITFWIMGILIFISDYSKVRRCTDKAAAIVVDVIKEEHWKYRKHGSGYETNYYPVIEFAVRDKKYRVKTRIKAYHSDTYKEGAELDIQYNPQNPSDLKLQGNSLRESVIGMGFMFLLGAVFAYIGTHAS